MEQHEKVLKVFIGILVAMVLGLGGYLVYDKGISKNVRKKESNALALTLDSTKSLNTEDINYSISQDGIKFDISVYSYLDEDLNKKLIFNCGQSVLTEYGLEYTLVSNCENKEIAYEGDIVDIHFAVFGQTVGQETVFFLKSDGTVEYLPIYHAIKNDSIKIYGKLEGVEKVVKFLSVSANPTDELSAGWHTTLAQRSDGTFYDLNELLPKQYYNMQ